MTIPPPDGPSGGGGGANMHSKNKFSKIFSSDPAQLREKTEGMVMISKKSSIKI